ncbi:MAG: RIP metalloprotease [Anaerofustis sp.]
MAVTIIVSLLIFGILIVSHEFGHFVTAVKSGVTVEEFAVGMGPKLFQKQTKITKFTLRLFPIGGFCRMKGEDAEDMEPGSFNSAHPLKKILILAAGSLMNFVVAIILFFILYLMIGFPTTTIASFTDSSPARDSGIVEGDTILRIENTEIKEWTDVTKAIQQNGDNQVTVTVRHQDGTESAFLLTPYYSDDRQDYMIGIAPTYHANLWKSFLGSFEMFWTYMKLIIGVFVGLFKGQFGLEAFSGPIGATVVIGQYLPQGLVYVLNIAASISISLGLFNLFPIPALDGSRILFIVIEMIKGSPVNKEMEGRVHFIGFVLLIAFAIFIAYRDIITYL